jgi:hypothetical protein
MAQCLPVIGKLIFALNERLKVLLDITDPRKYLKKPNRTYMLELVYRAQDLETKRLEASALIRVLCAFILVENEAIEKVGNEVRNKLIVLSFSIGNKLPESVKELLLKVFGMLKEEQYKFLISCVLCRSFFDTLVEEKYASVVTCLLNYLEKLIKKEDAVTKTSEQLAREGSKEKLIGELLLKSENMFLIGEALLSLSNKNVDLIKKVYVIEFVVENIEFCVKNKKTIYLEIAFNVLKSIVEEMKNNKGKLDENLVKFDENEIVEKLNNCWSAEYIPEGKFGICLRFICLFFFFFF